MDPARISPTFISMLISAAAGKIGVRKIEIIFILGPIKKHQAKVPKFVRSRLTSKKTKKITPSKHSDAVPN